MICLYMGDFGVMNCRVLLTGIWSMASFLGGFDRAGEVVIPIASTFMVAGIVSGGLPSGTTVRRNDDEGILSCAASCPAASGQRTSSRK
jgi:hypothetical protein